MEYSIVLYNDAKEDIVEIAKWYDLKSVELSKRFIEQFDIAINKISKTPDAFSYLYDDVRKIRLHKFPYLIFYKVKEQTVFIYGVIHAKRNPYLYKKRLRILL